ncbi:MAG TPA: hypothetical protein VN880_05195 [Solirubrobacteraceae bacterium]|jgi:hypothetical protein|nr:hypothetical protein [Solirubrobacteraceae bacterium]
MPSSLDGPPTLQDALNGRLASLVHIMKGRRSLFSGLGVLELDSGTVSLWDSSGRSAFAVPVQTVQARPQARRFALHQFFFQLHARDRWWYLSGAVQTKYSRAATRALAKRFDVRERAPRPTGMSMEAYLQLTKSPDTHQVVWVACWLEALARAGARVGGS